MKLFIWADPYYLKYGNSMVFAVAKNLASAKKQAAKGILYEYGKYKKNADMNNVAEELGDPTRIIDLPCAEWHEWSE